MISETEKILGQALVSAQLMGNEDLEAAIKNVESKKAPSLIIQLLKSEFLTFKTFQKFLAQNYKMRTTILAERDLPVDCIEQIGWDLIENRLVLPIMSKNVDGSQKLALGMVNPLDEGTITEVQVKTHASVTPLLISLPDFQETLKKIRPKKTTEEGAPEHFGQTIKKFKEEVMVKLELDPFEARALEKESYQMSELFDDLKKISRASLERNFQQLTDRERFEALANLMIKKNLMTKAEILVAGNVSRVFGEGKK